MNIIVNAFAFLDKYRSGENISINKGGSEEQIKELYLKNSCISLISAKRFNPQDEVALCTNIEVPQYYIEILNKEEIKILKIPFDTFQFEKEMKWSLAFYKICVLNHLLEETCYEKICLLDCDTIVNKDFAALWDEAGYGVLMYNTFDSYESKMRQDIKREFQELFPEYDCRNNEYFAGGEITGDRKYIKELVHTCRLIYNTMLSKKKETTVGDEFFWYGVDKMKPGLIIAGNGYYEHYWTYEGFRLISTNYFYKKVSVMHFPVEKEKGIIKVFDYYVRKREFPEQRILWHMLSLPQPDGRNVYIWHILSILKKKYIL